MTDETIRSTEISMATGGEEAESAVTHKEELMTTESAVQENGYESECSSRSEEEVAYSALEVEADAFTRFIERQRMDVMFELRRLRLGERPVTGQPNRERIETFLNNRQESQQETRVPSTRPVVPSAHSADIDALTNRRCVSAALTSSSFRQDLENAIRQSVGMRPTPPPPTVVPQTARPSTITTPVATQQSRPQVTPVAPVIAVQQPRIEAALNIARQERGLNAWEAITQLQREMIVLEISDLVHRQLVSSALESDFRQHLEQNVLTRIQRGVAPVQQDHQAVPAPAVPIPRLPAAPNARVSTVAVDALSTRLDAMQQMLQMMFSMQLDMQRSLRQEVASALANHTAAPGPSQPVNAGHCTICLTAVADTVLYRCGHLCVCYTCGLQLRQAASADAMKCPVCRAPVDDILRVYRSSRDAE